MQPIFVIKSERVLDIAEGVKLRGLDRSRFGAMTRFVSPPNIKYALFNEGSRSNSLFMKEGLSKLGAYILTNRIGMWHIEPRTITYLPSLSEITLVDLNWIDFRINMATPLALELKLE